MPKIIRKGKKNPNKPWVFYKTICPHCYCKFKLLPNDDVRFVPDQREGDYYMVECPDCKSDVTIAVSLLARR